MYPYTPARFVERYVATDTCRGVMRRCVLAGLAAGVVARRPGRTSVKLVFLDAADDEIAGALLDDVVRGLAATPGIRTDDGEICEIEWIVPPGERFRRWWATRGPARGEQEDDFLVYEFPLGELGRYAVDREGITT